MQRRLVIDTDTGSDDAVALMLAVADPDSDIAAVTTVAGNAPLDVATRNALYTLELMDAGDVPVYEGCDRPLLRPLETAQWVHGEDGMGDMDLSRPKGTPREEHAVDALRQLSLEQPGELTLITLGPLTNIAAAIARDPELLTRYAHTYIMGGAPDAIGNVTPVGEYNFWADPEAAAMTVAAAGAKTLVGWNISRTRAVIGPVERRVLEAMNTEYSRFTLDINRVLDQVAREYNGLEGFDLPDPATVAVALDPDLVTKSADVCMAVATADETRGLTYIDARHGEAPQPNITVVWDIDEAAFKQRVYDMCALR
ncbi:MAG: nucleoside hydrolase [Acidimicrobiia bacterium]|nr:nucleoside hydrolase [Acidimicrobiia bacterium]